MKIKLLSIIGIIALTLFTNSALASHLGDHLLFSAKMDGSQQVPEVVTDAQGVAGFTLNETRGQLCINVAVNGLSGPITSAHIHSGAMGATGDPIVDLTSGIINNQINLTVTGSDLTADIIAALLSGDTYINIHTEANPSGEIRGQIGLETDWSFSAKADGAQSVPMVDTDAMGLGVFNLSKNQSMINFQFIAEGLSGPITAAHLHIGAPGVAGAVEQNLSADIDGNTISGSFVPSAVLLENLMAGDIYLNVHTDDNPSGEIRAQLALQSFAFDASLDAAQAVPVSLSLATGISTMSMNNTMDTIWYDVLAQGLSGTINAAHIHEGEPGVAGGPLVNISADIDGNRITGMVTGADVTTDLINMMLRGETYINLHTDLYADGEIRGQVYRLAREGYTTLINSGQLVPMGSADGYGAGIVSIDRDQSNAHFMIVVGGLTAPLTSSHFHNAAVGSNGDVIFDLSPYFMGTGTDDAAYGYWTSEDLSAFGSDQSLMFRNEEVYINVHTEANPDGEVRGQVDRGQTCYNLLSVNEINKELASVNVYPNPFNDMITIETSELQGELSIQLMNMSGQTVMEPIVSNNSGNVQIATDLLEPGIYFVMITSEDELIAVQKVTKF